MTIAMTAKKIICVVVRENYMHLLLYLVDAKGYVPTWRTSGKYLKQINEIWNEICVLYIHIQS